MKRLTMGESITHRDIPFQVGICLKTYEDNMINDGEVVKTKLHPEYKFEEPVDGMMWQLLDDM